MAARDTPATTAARKAGLESSVHEYEHAPGASSYGMEAAETLGVDPARVFKTLVADLDGTLTVCIVRSPTSSTCARSASARASPTPRRPSGRPATSRGGSARSASAARCRRSSTSPRSSTTRSSSALAGAGSRSTSPRRTPSRSRARRCGRCGADSGGLLAARARAGGHRGVRGAGHGAREARRSRAAVRPGAPALVVDELELAARVDDRTGARRIERDGLEDGAPGNGPTQEADRLAERRGVLGGGDQRAALVAGGGLEGFRRGQHRTGLWGTVRRGRR